MPPRDDVALQALVLQLLARHGPTRSDRLAALARAEVHRVRFVLATLRDLGSVDFRVPCWHLAPPGHQAWPCVDRVLHGLPPTPPTTSNRRHSAGLSPKEDHEH